MKLIWLLTASALHLLAQTPGGDQALHYLKTQTLWTIAPGAFPSVPSLEALQRLRSPLQGVVFDLEAWPLSPASEQHHPVRTYAQAAAWARAHHAELIATPALDLVHALEPGYRGPLGTEFLRLGLARRIAPYAEVYEIQAQGIENWPDRYVALVRAIAEEVRAANPHALLLAGLSTNPSGRRVKVAALVEDVAKTRGLVAGYWLNIPSQGLACPRCGLPRPEVAISLLRALADPPQPLSQAEVYVEPRAGVSPLLNLIRSARRAIFLNVYYLDDRRILEALAAAHARGVRIEIILARKPYHLSREVPRELAEAQATGASVRLAPPRFSSSGDFYAFDHAKYLCTLHVCEVGTANFDYSAFHRNREYLVVTRDPEVVHALLQVFQADWDNRPAGSAPRRVLVLSPGAEPALRSVLEQPGPLEIESEELYPGGFLRVMEAKGSALRLLLPTRLSRREREAVAELEAAGVQVRFLAHPYLHAKLILGSSLAFIGSQNFSPTSLDHNREVGVLLEGRVLSVLRAQFARDWARAKRF